MMYDVWYDVVCGMVWLCRNVITGIFSTTSNQAQTVFHSYIWILLLFLFLHTPWCFCSSFCFITVVLPCKNIINGIYPTTSNQAWAVCHSYVLVLLLIPYQYQMYIFGKKSRYHQFGHQCHNVYGIIWLVTVVLLSIGRHWFRLIKVTPTKYPSINNRNNLNIQDSMLWESK